MEPDVIYKDAGGRTEELDIYVPDGPAPSGGRPVILAIHGGGWRQFDKGEFGRETADAFAPFGYLIVSINYALSSPGTPSWPANLEDVRDAVRWVRSHAAALGGDPDRIAAMGASAGGHLAALLGTVSDDPIGSGHAAASPDQGSSDVSARVQAVVDLYGPADLMTLAPADPSTLPLPQQGVASAVWQFLGGTPNDVPVLYRDASPVSHVSGDDPPMFLIHGGADSFVPADQSRELASALTAAGVTNRLKIVPRATHGFGFQGIGRSLPAQIDAFLDASWSH